LPDLSDECFVQRDREEGRRRTVAHPERKPSVADVNLAEHDIFGDGVNVAARLEALAEPGGICVSRVVRDQVRDRLDLTFEDLGEQNVKNIARPVRVYRVSDRTTELTGATVPSVPSISQTVIAPRLSIVVLPFTNLSNDPEQQYFADGITEDVTTDLSRIGGSFVISRNTAFTYRNKPVDTKRIGRELCVRYVLEGSVRRSGSQVRVNAQLIDAETDAHLWAERFHSDAVDLFVLQDEITRRIAVALNLELIGAEAARPTERPDAMDHILRGRAALYKPPSRDSYTESACLSVRWRSIRVCRGTELVGDRASGRVIDNVSDAALADIAHAEGSVGQALTASPCSPLAHFAKGQVLRAQRRPAEAISECETVIAFNRNHVTALAAMSSCKLHTGSIEQVIPVLQQVIRLSPRDPYIGAWYNRIGLLHLLQSRLDEAVLWLEKARNANPELSFAHAHLASTYALKGQTEHASAELAEARRLSPDGRYSSSARLQATAYYGAPTIRALYEATYFAGLRKAGMPEE
jgi:adenylate cyclase